MKQLMMLVTVVSLSGCSMFQAVESLPVQLSETNQHLSTAGAQVVRSNDLLQTSNAAMKGLPTLMGVTNAGVEKTNTLMGGTHELMAGTNALMRSSNSNMLQTNALMRGTHELMQETNQHMLASNTQLNRTFWLIMGTCVLSCLAGLVLFVKFRKIPAQFEEYLTLVRAQEARASERAKPYSQSRRLASQTSGTGAVSA